MTYNEHAETRTEAQQDEAILFLGMVRIVNEERVFIRKDG
jgi:hypothetical protein